MSQPDAQANPEAQRLAAAEETAERAGIPATTQLLDEIQAYFARFVALPGKAEADFIALFILHTFAFDAAQSTPYVAITSPERGCGKTQTAEVVEKLSAGGWKIDGAPTEAVLFRKIERDRPTVIIDEADRLFKSGSDRIEPLTALVNGGNRKGATVPRVVPKGNDFDLVDFSTFCPKVLVGIDHSRWPDTIRDRSIAVVLKRATKAERAKLARWRPTKAEVGAARLRSLCERWADAHCDRLSEAEPEDMQELSPRAFDGWEPLLGIAEVAGKSWLLRAKNAAMKLSGERQDEESSLGSQLLTAIREAFGDEEWINTTELLEVINADDSLPFGGWNQGSGLNARGLAGKLKPYGIKPHAQRRGDATLRGYKAEEFTEAWARYAAQPPQGDESAHNPQHPDSQAESSATLPATPSETDLQQTSLTQPGDPLARADVADVADVAGFPVRDATPAEEAEIERLAAEFEETAA